MEIKTVIEIEAWGDFGVKYTECVMISEKELDFEQIKKDFLEKRGIESFNGHEYKDFNGLTKDFIQYLYLLGFQKLKTNKVIISD